MSDPSLHASSLNISETPSPKDAQVVGGHTETPWRVGYTGRCIIKEVPGLSDSDDGYTVAVLTAHSLLPDSEAKANAALIVKAVNSHEANEAKIAAAVKALEWLIALASEMNDASNEGGQLDIRYDSAVATLSSLKEGK